MSMYLAAALDGFGAHPAAWRFAGNQASLFAPERVTALARLAERGLLDFVTLDDQHPGTPEPGRAHGALDAFLTLASAATQTVHIGLIPTCVAVGEPAVVAGRVETFDRIAGGRGGWRPRVALTDEQRRRASADPAGHAAFTEERFADAAEFVGAVTAFWGSWREEPDGSLSGIGRVARPGRWHPVAGYARVCPPRRTVSR